MCSDAARSGGQAAAMQFQSPAGGGPNCRHTRFSLHDFKLSLLLPLKNLNYILNYNSNSVYMLLSLCGYMQVSAGANRGQRHQIPWI